MDKIFNGLQIPNLTEGQARNSDPGFLRLYFKNGHIHVTDDAGEETKLTGVPYSVTQADVTQYEGVLSIQQSQISDLSITFADIDPNAVQLSTETFSASNTTLMTSAAIDDLITSKGYITSYTVTQGDVTQYQSALSITESQISDFKSYVVDSNNAQAFINAFVLPTTDGTNGQVLTTDGSGNLSFTSVSGTGNETDPVFTASPAFSITSTQITNWDSAYSWGDHSTVGYLTQNQAITFTGDVTVTQLSPTNYAIAVDDNSHNHTISNVAGLQAELDGKESAITKSVGYVTWDGSQWVFLNDTYVDANATQVSFQDLVVSGNLTVQGTTTTVQTQTLSSNSPLIILNDSATTQPDIGLVGEYVSASTPLITGVFRDATDGVWKFFENSQQVVNDSATINPSATGYQLAKVQADEFIGAVSYTNVTDRPDPIIRVNLTGDINGASVATLTNLDSVTLSLAASVSSTADLTIANLDITGDLNVFGTTTTVNQTTLTVSDSKIFLADQNPSDAIDVGVVFNYNDGVNKTAGLFRDATDKRWKLFASYDSSGLVGTAIDTAAGSFSYGDLQLNRLYANVTGNVTGQVSDISNFSTTDVAEGTNQYFTTARANTAIDARVTAPFVNALNISYNNLSNLPTIPSTLTDLGISDGTSGQVLSTDGAGNFTFATPSTGVTTGKAIAMAMIFG